MTFDEYEQGGITPSQPTQGASFESYEDSVKEVATSPKQGFFDTGMAGIAKNALFAGLDYISSPRESPDKTAHDIRVAEYKPRILEGMRAGSELLDTEPTDSEDYAQAFTENLISTKGYGPGDSSQVIRALQAKTGKPVSPANSLMIRKYLKNRDSGFSLNPLAQMGEGVKDLGAGVGRTVAGVAENMADVATAVGATDVGPAVKEVAEDYAALYDAKMKTTADRVGSNLLGEAGAIAPMVLPQTMLGTLAVSSGYLRGQGGDATQSAVAGGADALLLGLGNKLAKGKKLITAEAIEKKGIKALEGDWITTDSRDLITRLGATTGKSEEEILQGAVDIMNSTGAKSMTEDQFVRYATQGMTGGAENSPRAGRYLQGAEAIDSTVAPTLMREAQARLDDIAQAVKSNPTLSAMVDEFTTKNGNFSAVDWDGLHKAMLDTGLPADGPMMKRISSYSKLDDVGTLNKMQGANPVARAGTSGVGQRTDMSEQVQAEMFNKIRHYLYSKIPAVNKDQKIEQAIIRSIRDGEITPQKLRSVLQENGADMARVTDQELDDLVGEAAAPSPRDPDVPPSPRDPDVPPSPRDPDVDPDVASYFDEAAEPKGEPYDPYANAPEGSVYEPGPKSDVDPDVAQYFDESHLEVGAGPATPQSRGLAKYLESKGMDTNEASVLARNLLDPDKLEQTTLNESLNRLGLGSEKQLNEFLSPKASAHGGPTLLGATAGVEENEDGSIGFDPVKGLAGAAAGTLVGTKAGRGLLKGVGEKGVDLAFDSPYIGPLKIIPSNSTAGKAVAKFKQPGVYAEDQFGKMIMGRIDDPALAKELEKLGGAYSVDDMERLVKAYPEEERALRFMQHKLTSLQERGPSGSSLDNTIRESRPDASPGDVSELLGRQGYDVESQLITALDNFPTHLPIKNVDKWFAKQRAMGNLGKGEYKYSGMEDFVNTWAKNNPGERISKETVLEWAEKTAGSELSIQSELPEGILEWKDFTGEDFKPAMEGPSPQATEKLSEVAEEIMNDTTIPQPIRDVAEGLYNRVGQGEGIDLLQPDVQRFLDMNQDTAYWMSVYNVNDMMSPKSRRVIKDYKVNFSNYRAPKAPTAKGQIKELYTSREYSDVSDTIQGSLRELRAGMSPHAPSQGTIQEVMVNLYHEDYKGAAQNLHNLRSSMFKEGGLTPSANSQIDYALGVTREAEDTYRSVHGKASGGLGPREDTVDKLTREERLRSQGLPRSKHLSSTEPYHTRTSTMGDSLVVHEFQSDFWTGADKSKDMPFEKWLPKAFDDVLTQAKREGKDSVLIPINKAGTTEAPSGLDFRDATNRKGESKTTPEFYMKMVNDEAKKTAEKYGLEYDTVTVGDSVAIRLRIPKTNHMNVKVY